MRVFAALTALVLLTAACGDDDDADTSATTEAAGATTTSAAPEESTTTTAAEEASGAALVEVSSSDLGDILVSEGRTLYIFMPDNAGPPTCTGDCAQAWPALIAEDGATVAGEGLDESLFGTVASADGSGEQVTVDGWPLYFFANDAAPGDTNGQGVGGVWFVVDPDGVPVEQSLEGLVGGY